MGGRRLVVYVVWDRRGDVEDFIPCALAGLREHADRGARGRERVVDGDGSGEARAGVRTRSWSVRIVGFDIWAHKEALDHRRRRGSAEFDEVVLTNDTWFGPVRPFGPVFERMDERAGSFLGHDRSCAGGAESVHGQGCAAVSPAVVLDRGAARDVPVGGVGARTGAICRRCRSYFDAVLKHEAVFTEHFTDARLHRRCRLPAAPTTTRRTPRSSTPSCCCDDGCPILKRRPFFQWPPFLDRHAVDRSLDARRRPSATAIRWSCIWQNLARNVRAEGPQRGCRDARGAARRRRRRTTRERPFRIVVVAAHLLRGDDRRDARSRRHAARARTTSSSRRPTRRRPRRSASIVGAPGEAGARSTCASLESNDGRDQSAFLIGCRDILLGERLRPRRQAPLQEDPAGRLQRRAALQVRSSSTTCSNSPGYAANLLALFQKEPGLGLVYPPMIHIGYPDDGPRLVVEQARIRECSRASSASACRSTTSRRSRPTARCTSPGPRRCACSSSTTGRTRTSAAPRRTATAASRTSSSAMPVVRRRRARLSHAAPSPTPSTCRSATRRSSSTSTRCRPRSPGYAYEQIELLRRAGYVGEGRARDFVRIYLRLHHPAPGRPRARRARTRSLPRALGAQAAPPSGDGASPDPPGHAVRVASAPGRMPGYSSLVDRIGE